MVSQVLVLIKKELLSEWRQKYALNGLILYIISTVFVCYMSFGVKTGTIDKVTWNALFWIIILFTAVNSVAKSFIQESHGRLLYYYSIAKAEAIILSKIVYNSLLLLVLSLFGILTYTLVMGNPIQNLLLFLTAVILGSIGFASSLTLISGIAAKASSSGTLMAILSFPVILPLVLMVIRLSKNAMDGIDLSASTDEVLILLAINILIGAASFLLFPYLWRS